LEMHLVGSCRGLWMDVERVLYMLLLILTIDGLTFLNDDGLPDDLDKLPQRTPTRDLKR
jgi:hypothetical protein